MIPSGRLLRGSHPLTLKVIVARKYETCRLDGLAAFSPEHAHVSGTLDTLCADRLQSLPIYKYRTSSERNKY